MSGFDDQEATNRAPTTSLVRIEASSRAEAGILQLIITIIDHEVLDKAGAHPKYTGALIETLQRHGANRPNEYHGMYEVKRYPRSEARQPRFLGHTRFFPLEAIDRSVHLVPADFQFVDGDITKDVFFVNNTVDWDQYNTLCDPEFLKLWESQSRKLSRT